MNMNRGTKIFLRLRPPGALDTFYDTEQLVLVMLHEVSCIICARELRKLCTEHAPIFLAAHAQCLRSSRRELLQATRTARGGMVRAETERLFRYVQAVLLRS